MRSLTRRAVMVQKIGGDDFVVVVGSVRESSSPVAIAQRIDAGDIGAELIIHLDVTALIALRRRRFPGRDHPCWARGRRREANASQGLSYRRCCNRD